MIFPIKKINNPIIKVTAGIIQKASGNFLKAKKEAETIPIVTVAPSNTAVTLFFLIDFSAGIN